MIKINWGHGLALFIGAFMIMILGFVITSTRYSSELVAADYYLKEVNYQQHIDKQNNTRDWSLSVNYTEEGLKLKFPQSITNGTIQFFRPSDQQLDIKMPIELNADHQQLIDLKDIQPGFWRVKLNWTKEGQGFFYEKSFVML